MDTYMPNGLTSGSDGGEFCPGSIGDMSQVDRPNEGFPIGNCRSDPVLTNLKSRSFKSLCEGRQYDSGFYGSTSYSPVPDPPKSGALVTWEVEFLRLWSSNIGRSASKNDVLLFRGLLEADEEAISASLQGTGRLERLEQGIQISNPTTLPWPDEMLHCLAESTVAPYVAPDVPHSFVQMPTAVDNVLSQGADPISQPLTTYHTAKQGHRVETNEIALVDNSKFGGVERSDNFNLSPQSLHANSVACGKECMVSRDVFEPWVSAQRTTTSTSHQSGLDLFTILNRPLRALIRLAMSKKAKRGCGPIRSHENQQGRFPCTLGCGRRFRAAADRVRHEEIVYPQKFWFCYACGDPTDPSLKFIFTREDKIRQHIKSFKHVHISLNQCRISNIRTLCPERCGLCSHHRHPNWKERCDHIAWHCKKGHYAANTHIARTRQAQGLLNNNEDDDNDDEDDNDEDDNDEDDNDEDDKDDTDDNDDEDGKDEPDYGGDQDNGQSFNNDRFGGAGGKRDGDGADPSYDDLYNNGTEDLFGEWLRNSPSLWNYPTYVRITPLHSATGDERRYPTTSTSCIKWLEKLRKKGATSSIFTVELSLEPSGQSRPKPRTFAVKQYNSSEYCLFEREVGAFTILQDGGRTSTSIIRCYGTFVYSNEAGQQKYNLILEYGECDLREYWASRSRPQSIQNIGNFWKSLFNIARSLTDIHHVRLYSSKTVYGVHADIKPDNIIYVDGTFKLADFGFTVFFDRDDTEDHGCDTVPGGTPMYAAPELYDSKGLRFASPSRESDMWSFGCVLFEAATWLIEGFHVLKKFEDQRRKTFSGNLTAGFVASFHDGREVSKVVRYWHSLLTFRACGAANVVTRNVLELVAGCLLLKEPKTRLSAGVLNRYIDSIFTGYWLQQSVPNANSPRLMMRRCDPGPTKCLRLRLRPNVDPSGLIPLPHCVFQWTEPSKQDSPVDQYYSGDLSYSVEPIRSQQAGWILVTKTSSHASLVSGHEGIEKTVLATSIARIYCRQSYSALWIQISHGARQSPYSNFSPALGGCFTTCDERARLLSMGIEAGQGPQRTEDDKRKLVFHQGRIATGNSVIQNGKRRDEICVRCDGTLCVEMEAAGVDANRRCLVIRGISDYADSHKNDMWRSYAARTPAAYTRELFCRVQPAMLKDMQAVPEGCFRWTVPRETIECLSGKLNHCKGLYDCAIIPSQRHIELLNPIYNRSEEKHSSRESCIKHQHLADKDEDISMYEPCSPVLSSFDYDESDSVIYIYYAGHSPLRHYTRGSRVRHVRQPVLHGRIAKRHGLAYSRHSSSIKRLKIRGIHVLYLQKCAILHDTNPS